MRAETERKQQTRVAKETQMINRRMSV